MIKFNSGHIIEEFLFLPPFALHEPLGLNEELNTLFYKDRDIRSSFFETNKWHISVIWDISYGQIHVNDEHACRVKNNTHFTYYCSWPSENKKPDINGTVYIHNGYWLYMHQHALDYGIPSMVTALTANKIDPNSVKLISTACNPYSDAYISRFGFNHDVEKCKSSYVTVSAKRIIVVAVMKSTHPFFYKMYYEKMKFPNVKRDKIFIFPRRKNDAKQGKPDRIVYNLLDIKKPLEDKYGLGNVVVIEDGCKNTSFCFDLLPRAKYIIGPHGGALYNAYFAGKDVSIIELLPIKKNGEFPTPHNKYWTPHSVLNFANGLSQKFYRYYTFSNDINYNINVTDFMDWFNKFVK
ncbi:hypothetical protein TVAG_156990 [Trichomonas vaginalis G3]|uniref:Glycosyltransferase 61 catalytic domain-containing protein n=1 Tax=Trichomonas vaginalis (strain ATCC PRA-98 / G3) TaxID=412133 RepID=A2FM36_TRIV3|nr:glycosyltransferase family [Trichomonas vaginalis G3]EAX94038.1 hypothetical protein TVAG_156990 [Trichomonas vaginalis G3]KAI5494521.1 glycosyltransferase family [Trichomonas vaginalis G3]|eukprot:XP_001306968.1 hypothetical protein [Trichomonas vaginalis G3]